MSTPRVEAFYWVAITFSQTLGTALGDWLADTGGLGYTGGAVVFASRLAVVAGLYFWTHVSRVALFWGAFVLTRPLGATVGDFLDKPVHDGGMAVSRPLGSGMPGRAAAAGGRASRHNVRANEMTACVGPRAPSTDRTGRS